jgi:hypothetical protein
MGMRAARRTLAYVLGEIGAGFLQLAFWVGGLRPVEGENFSDAELTASQKRKGS